MFRVSNFKTRSIEDLFNGVFRSGFCDLSNFLKTKGLRFFLKMSMLVTTLKAYNL